MLCGDLNLPREETVHGEVITFAENHPQFLERWDAAERSLLTGSPSGISPTASAPCTATTAAT